MNVSKTNASTSNHESTLYISSTGKIGTYNQWHKEAVAFYKECEIPMPTDWLKRWTKIVGLTPLS